MREEDEAAGVGAHLRPRVTTGFRLSVKVHAGGNHAQWRPPPISVAFRAFLSDAGSVRGNEFVRRILALGKERGVEVR